MHIVPLIMLCSLIGFNLLELGATDNEDRMSYWADRFEMPSTIEPQIDAFNMNICGRAKFSEWPWTEKESAFGCGSGGKSTKSSSSLDHIEMGNEFFPFYAQVDIYVHEHHHLDQCSGVIIHKDIVLTSEGCLRRHFGGPYVHIKVRIGAEEGRSERAYKVYWTRRPTIEEREEGINIALLKLERPLSYIRDRVAPACLKLDQSHLNTANCALAFDEGYFPVKAKRGCKLATNHTDSCYSLLNQRFMILNKFTDVGGPVVCYDKCAGNNKTMAYVVGVINKEPSYEAMNLEDTFAIVSDIYKQREAFRGLVSEVIRY